MHLRDEKKMNFRAPSFQVWGTEAERVFLPDAGSPCSAAWAAGLVLCPPASPGERVCPSGTTRCFQATGRGVPCLPSTPQLPLAPSLLLELLPAARPRPAAAAAQHGGTTSTNRGAAVRSSRESPQAEQRDEATATKLGRFPFLSLDHDFVALIHVPR